MKYGQSYTQSSRFTHFYVSKNIFYSLINQAASQSRKAHYWGKQEKPFLSTVLGQHS